MKVAQINTFCGVKSTGRITTDIASLLERDGDACVVAYGAEQAPEALARFGVRFSTVFGRKLHGALRKGFDAEGYASGVSTRKLVRYLKRYKPDVIHLHNLHGCYLQLAILFAYLKRCGVPVVWTFHDCWPFTGHCAYFESARCYKWESGCERCPRQRDYPVCYGLDGSRRNYARKKRLFTGVANMTLVTPCEWLAGYVKQSFLQAYPVRVLYNGVNRAVFHPVEAASLREEHSIRAQHIALAVAADWDERKGLRFLPELAALLGADVQVVALGLSREQIDALPPSVLGLPPTQGVRQLVQWYSLADCLVNPTMEDNMPLVNLEALACGTPVAVFATGGSKEAVDDTCGRVVEQGNVRALAQAVRELVAAKAALREGCLRRAERFDSERCYREYLALYREVSTARRETTGRETV